jgi:Uma2 family endonuclease
MTAAAAPVRLDYNDYVLYTETHPEGAFELLDGVIFELAPEGDAHVRTRMAIELYLTQTLDLARYTPCTEVSFPAPDWFDGPRPDNLVARGPGLVDGRIRERPIAEEVALVIEVSSTSRRKDQQKAKAYARLAIPEYWLVDLESAEVIVYRDPAGEGGSAEYQWVGRFGREQTISSKAVDGLTVATDFLLQLAAAAR